MPAPHEAPAELAPADLPVEIAPASPAEARNPGREQLRTDAEWLAGLYPVRHAPVAAPWHPTCIHVPASIRALVEGMPTYGA